MQTMVSVDTLSDMAADMFGEQETEKCMMNGVIFLSGLDKDTFSFSLVNSSDSDTLAWQASEVALFMNGKMVGDPVKFTTWDGLSEIVEAVKGVTTKYSSVTTNLHQICLITTTKRFWCLTFSAIVVLYKNRQQPLRACCGG